MTERWLQGMRRIEDLSPTAGLLERAKEDVTHRPIPRSSAPSRLVAAAVGVSIALAGTAVAYIAIVRSGPEEPSAGTMATFTSPEVPWTFEYPSVWSVQTMDRASPKITANMVRTTVANVAVPQDAEYGPNSSANATSLFGDNGAVVLIERLWTNAMPLGGVIRGPGPFAEDSQNPGWTFRERARCDGTLCYHVIEWLGPAASEQDAAAAATVADSVGLSNVERWTESDGIRTTLHDEDDLFTVTYPNDWFASDEPINDRVCSPFEILALATYPLRPGGDAVIDAQLPSNAVDDLGPNEILIWVNDSGNACGGTRESGSGEGFPARPDHFQPASVCAAWTRLCPEPEGRELGIPGIRAWWLGFRDEGRGFYAFVGMGERVFADPARAQLAWDVLDSLRFLPR
jgi:hypothetical protein